MPIASRNRLVFHKVIGTALLACSALLIGCTIPEKPEGVETGGFTRIAEQLHARGDDEGAADFYTRAIQRTPNDPRPRREFGEILESHGDLNGAAEQYRVALGIPPGDPVQYRTPEIASDDSDLLRDYGRVLIKLGRPTEAQPVYARAVEVDPNDVRALNGLGVALDELNNHEAAQKIYKEALDAKPDDFATLANLGHSYVLSGAYDEAIALLEPHLKDPGAPPALRQNLAEAYGMAGMDADAQRVSRLDLSPEQTKHNLSLYRSKRGHASAFYADLGHFPTQEIAVARVDDIKAQFPDETEGLTVAAAAQVSAIGGTPSFAVRVTGFEHASTLRAFCLKLKKQGTACTARMDM